jgi:hypothetical protein
MPLHDLDELVFRVRDANSRRYFSEAVRAYHCGANRAAILTAWVTVVSDILSKIRELEAKGDATAHDFVSSLITSTHSNNVGRLLLVEHNILDTARHSFKFISAQQYEDLRRLMADRQRCAHPTFDDENILFEPSAEIVRAHLAHAVLHLLQHAPRERKIAAAGATSG